MKYDFANMRGQRPFGTFPKIHPFWYRHSSPVPNVQLRSSQIELQEKQEQTVLQTNKKIQPVHLKPNTMRKSNMYHAMSFS